MIMRRKRALYDAADQVLVRESGLYRCGRVFRIRREIRVWVYVNDEGRAARIDTKIDARITVELEQGPGGQGELPKHLGKFGLLLFQTETAQCADIGGAIRCPFGVVAEDFGHAGFQAPKNELGNRKHLHTRNALKQGKVEFTPLDKGFDEMLGVEEQIACSNDLRGIRATH